MGIPWILGRMIDVQKSTDDPALTKSKVKYQLLGLKSKLGIWEFRLELVLIIFLIWKLNFNWYYVQSSVHHCWCNNILAENNATSNWYRE